MTTSALIGYARTSTTDQKAGLEAQLRDLKAAGAERLFQEEISSVAAARHALAAALDYIREGDTLIVTKLDRLARSVAVLLSINEALRDKGVGLRLLSLTLETPTPHGNPQPQQRHAGKQGVH